jgi:hypothetical protein
MRIHLVRCGKEKKNQFGSNLLEQKSMVREFVMKHCDAMHHYKETYVADCMG